MLRKRISFFLLAFFLLAISGWLVWSAVMAGTLPPVSASAVWEGELFWQVEDALVQAAPYRKQLRAAVAGLRFRLGEREQAGVYLSENGLLQDIRQSDNNIYYENMEALTEFAGRSRIQVAAALIPTACAIRQEDLPPFAQPLNQRQMIQSLYRNMGKSMHCIDLYQLLFQNRSQYLYYRTEENLTALGGYYVYTCLAEQLGFRALPQSSFIVQFAENDYRGSLQEQVDYRCQTPDVLSLYHYGRERDFWLCHQAGGETWYQDSLFDLKQLEDSDDPTDLYLGGTDGLLLLENRALQERELLLFGDQTAKAYLPFLAQHYSQVTFVNLESADEALVRRLDIYNYDQVLFVYSLRTFMQSDAIPHALWLSLPERQR